MDGYVNTAVKKSDVELTCKKALPADISERLIEYFVSSCLFRCWKGKCQEILVVRGVTDR
jgi:hypothetical protein